MTTTSWSRCFKLLLAALLVATAAVAPAAGISASAEDVPEQAKAGTQVSATVTLTEPYRNPSLEAWTLVGETELTGVTWTVTYYDQTGSKVGQESFDGQSFDGAEVVADDGTSEIRVKVTGTVPDVESYSYDPAQSIKVMTLTQARSGGSSSEIGTWETHHYTEESAAARSALDAAAAAIDAAEGANTDQARQALDNGRSAFENGNFELATTLAGDAESQADAAEESSRMRQLAFYGVGGLVALGALVGGVFWYRSRRTTYDKLG